MISAKNDEPGWLLAWRLGAFRHFLTLDEPEWANVRHPPIDYQDMHYWAAPKPKGRVLKSLDEVDPEIRATFDKLGISLAEQERLSGVAVDAILDSVSVATTFKATLAEAGVIFCSFSEAVREHPDLVRAYLGSVVGYRDNFFAALNSAVFSHGSFCFVPAGVRCPMELSTYFRINAAQTGQFERTLIVAEEGASVSYLEGCTAPMRDENQLHAAVVELVALDDASIKYSTVQNWYPGDADGRGGIYNFVTKRGRCAGRRSKISWTQVETGSAITWKYPSVILQGDESVGEFYSVAVTTNHQQADTGTKMIHIGRNTRSTILSKGVSAGQAQNTYRGLVKIPRSATGARNHTRCDSLLIGPECGAAGPFEISHVLDALHEIYDPEIPVSIVELGLVFRCEEIQCPDGTRRIEIDMSMTAPGCGMGDILRADALRAVQAVPGVDEVDVTLVWTPPWSVDRMSEAARLQLGLL